MTKGKLTELLNKYHAGDRVTLKPAFKTSSIGYKEMCGKTLTIKEIFPQYQGACSFEESEDDSLFRLQDLQ